MTSVRINDNRVSVNHGNMWIKGNLSAHREAIRCEGLRQHNPDCAKRADEIRAALHRVGYFERETV